MSNICADEFVVGLYSAPNHFIPALKHRETAEEKETPDSVQLEHISILKSIKRLVDQPKAVEAPT